MQNNEGSTSSLLDNFKHSNILMNGVPEGEEKEQEIRNLFEKIMKESFPNLVKEIDMHVQKAQTVPIRLDPKSTTPRHIIIKMPNVKDKERILKAAREKQSYLQRSSHKIINWFLKWNFAGKKGLARSIQNDDKQGPTM